MTRWSLPSYRLRLGWLLGHRFMLITDVGRCAGKTRWMRVMVLRFDGRSDEALVAAGSVSCLLAFIGQVLGNGILIQGNLAGAALTTPFAITAILDGRSLMRVRPAPKTPGSEARLTSRAA